MLFSIQSLIEFLKIRSTMTKYFYHLKNDEKITDLLAIMAYNIHNVKSTIAE